MENLRDWSLRMHGARFCLRQLKDLFDKRYANKQRLFDREKVYDDAVYKLVMSDLKMLDKFLNGDEIWYRNHKTNDKGKVIEVEAYFV